MWDKWYRLARGFHWWPDEQPSPEVRNKVESVLDQRCWQVDIVLTHTCPLKYEPREVFLQGLDQSTVDKSTEIWLDEIESKLQYERWYCGHYHTEKQIDKIRFMFEDYALIPHTVSIEEEKAIIAKMQRQADYRGGIGPSGGYGGGGSLTVPYKIQQGRGQVSIRNQCLPLSNNVTFISYFFLLDNPVRFFPSSRRSAAHCCGRRRSSWLRTS